MFIKSVNSDKLVVASRNANDMDSEASNVLNWKGYHDQLVMSALGTE